MGKRPLDATPACRRTTPQNPVWCTRGHLPRFVAPQSALARAAKPKCDPLQDSRHLRLHAPNSCSLSTPLHHLLRCRKWTRSALREATPGEVAALGVAAPTVVTVVAVAVEALTAAVWAATLIPGEAAEGTAVSA